CGSATAEAPRARPPAGGWGGGAPAEAEVPAADTSTVQDADGLGAFHYQWQRSVDGTTWGDVGIDAATYTLGDADVGLQFRVMVSYTDGNGAAESLTSDATAAAAKRNDA